MEYFLQMQAAVLVVDNIVQISSHNVKRKAAVFHLINEAIYIIVFIGLVHLRATLWVALVKITEESPRLGTTIPQQLSVMKSGTNLAWTTISLNVGAIITSAVGIGAAFATRDDAGWNYALRCIIKSHHPRGM